MEVKDNVATYAAALKGAGKGGRILKPSVPFTPQKATPKKVIKQAKRAVSHLGALSPAQARALTQQISSRVVTGGTGEGSLPAVKKGKKKGIPNEGVASEGKGGRILNSAEVMEELEIPDGGSGEEGLSEIQEGGEEAQGEVRKEQASPPPSYSKETQGGTPAEGALAEILGRLVDKIDNLPNVQVASKGSPSRARSKGSSERASGSTARSSKRKRLASETDESGSGESEGDGDEDTEEEESSGNEASDDDGWGEETKPKAKKKKSKKKTPQAMRARAHYLQERIKERRTTGLTKGSPASILQQDLDGIRKFASFLDPLTDIASAMSSLAQDVGGTSPPNRLKVTSKLTNWARKLLDHVGKGMDELEVQFSINEKVVSFCRDNLSDALAMRDQINAHRQPVDFAKPHLHITDVGKEAEGAVKSIIKELAAAEKYHAVHGPPGGARKQGGGGGSGREPKGGACYNCGGTGHAAATCKAPCRICSDTRHTSKTCPNRPQSVGEKARAERAQVAPT